VSVAATALGATVIEKHVTLRRSDGGVDSAFSLEPEELAQLVEGCDFAARALGSASAWSSAAEAESLRLRPSLYVSADVRAGEIASPANVRSVRPAGGLQPRDIELVMGRAFAVDAPMGTPTSWGLFS
jgi:sialic acid synthase SpsE